MVTFLFARSIKYLRTALSRSSAKLVAAVVVIVVAAAAGFATYWLRNYVEYIKVSAPYAFLVNGSGGWTLEYYGPGKDLHELHIKNVSMGVALWVALNEVYSFDQSEVPQHPGYQDLVPIIVIGAQGGTIKIPVRNGILYLNDIDQDYYTIVVVPRQYASLFMMSLDTGYKASAMMTMPYMQYLEYADPQTFYLIQEIYEFVTGTPSSGQIVIYQPPITYVTLYFDGAYYVLVTNNGSLIPWAYLWEASAYEPGATINPQSLTTITISLPYLGQELPFVVQASNQFYNGSSTITLS